jgi:hypothetical protein
MKQYYLQGARSIAILAVLLTLGVFGFISCHKNKTDAISELKTGEKKEALKPSETDRLFSVANVYYTPDGKRAEAWFFETPMVFEFSADGPNTKANFDVLKNAKENKLPVNVKLIANAENLIDKITPATEEQVAGFKAEVAKRETAEMVTLPDPKQPSNSLVGVVPSTTTLNNIFNTVRSQCCKLPGVLIYGPRIPFQFVADGCYARAHKARQLIESYYGYTSYKVFNYACDYSGTLSVNATLWGNNCCVHWWYHVASYVIVQVGAYQYAYVIDPSMFSGPVSIPTWVAAQKNLSCGYGGAAQGQVYYTSNAYAPSVINAPCTLVPYADNTYTAANATCTAYCPKQGCSY